MAFKSSLWDDSDPLYAPGLKHRKVIGHYKSDEYSQIHDVRPNARLDYLKVLGKIEEAIGEVLIQETDFSRMMSWKKSMERKGRSTNFIKKWFTHWGIVNSHGIKIGVTQCSALKAIRGEMRIKSPSRRSTYITRPQVDAVVAEADSRGLTHVALAVLIRFEFMLRGVDVHSQWEPKGNREGGIQSDGQMWVDGLTWDRFDTNLTTFTKVISKTRDSLPEPYTFDLANTSDIRDRLAKVPQQHRTGPVIVLSTGKPPKNSVITRMFKSIVRDLGLPEELHIRDTLSGAITEAKGLADPHSLQYAAQHTQSTTTDIYIRDRSGAASKIVRLRKQGWKV
ncbi:hypothetical protein [Pseudophaeobacter sp.]|uniref:hypothetical protein n=1 Tax=Pseudophaeobacter sp. TaxID=1971739 RepID=UPI00326629F7